ncbi:MAG: GNAT family N-acetyltransferase [Anaerolineae bacterium]|nr:GNAT family N-acetyltransferase [Anaerolineae bacterium]
MLNYDARMEAVRKARPEDLPAIRALQRRTRFKMPCAWRCEECQAFPANLYVAFGDEGEIGGALCTWPDGAPAARVRMAALENDGNTSRWLGLVLSRALTELCRSGVRELTWIDYEGWAGHYLSRGGFVLLERVITLAKFDYLLPEVRACDVLLRSSSEQDVSGIVAVDRAAFPPHWWHGEVTIRRNIALSPYFVVAEAEGEIVGYASGDLHKPLAHLNRIAVAPAYQGRGIGSRLLRDALLAFWAWGAEEVTLNTQQSNHTSQRLYRRFGFEPTGESVAVWKTSSFGHHN